MHRAHAVPAGPCRGLGGGRLNFQSAEPNLPPARARFVEASAETLPTRRWANKSMMVTRASQVMAGELARDQARARIDPDIVDQVAAAR